MSSGCFNPSIPLKRDTVDLQSFFLLHQRRGFPARSTSREQTAVISCTKTPFISAVHMHIQSIRQHAQTRTSSKSSVLHYKERSSVKEIPGALHQDLTPCRPSLTHKRTYVHPTCTLSASLERAFAVSLLRIYSTATFISLLHEASQL